MVQSGRQRAQRLREQRVAAGLKQKVVWIRSGVDLLIDDLSMRTGRSHQDLMVAAMEDGLGSMTLKQHKEYSRELRRSKS